MGSLCVYLGSTETFKTRAECILSSGFMRDFRSRANSVECSGDDLRAMGGTDAVRLNLHRLWAPCPNACLSKALCFFLMIKMIASSARHIPNGHFSWVCES